MVIKRYFLLHYACLLLCLISPCLSFSLPFSFPAWSDDEDYAWPDEEDYVDDFWCGDCYDPECDCYYDYGSPGFYESYYPVYIWRNGARVRVWRNRLAGGNRYSVRRDGTRVPIRRSHGRPVSGQPVRTNRPVRHQPMRTQSSAVRRSGGVGGPVRTGAPIRASHGSSSMGRSMGRSMGHSMGGGVRGGFGGGRSMGGGHAGGGHGGGRR